MGFFIFWTLELYMWVIILRALFSWFRPPRYNRTYYQLERILVKWTEPVLGPIRRFLPSSFGVDLSPVVAVILISLLQRVFFGL
ncbi:MAG: YggT family protein [Firmicutes bacterium]|nr:YggT family protein [Bacillota bacterium]MCL5040798.1 YggT family protein [Bacillota bacterium]